MPSLARRANGASAGYNIYKGTAVGQPWKTDAFQKWAFPMKTLQMTQWKWQTLFAATVLFAGLWFVAPGGRCIAAEKNEARDRAVPLHSMIVGEPEANGKMVK